MTVHSRRKFLKSSSVGAAVVGVALTPGLFRGSAAAAAPAPAGALPDGPFTAYVRDHETGDITVIIGEHEVLYRDRDLAARLARIATHARPA